MSDLIIPLGDRYPPDLDVRLVEGLVKRHLNVVTLVTFLSFAISFGSSYHSLMVSLRHSKKHYRQP